MFSPTLPPQGPTADQRLATLAQAFVDDVSAGREVDPVGLAEAVDAALGALVRQAADVAGAPEAFRIRRALELAARVVETFAHDEVDADGGHAVTG